MSESHVTADGPKQPPARGTPLGGDEGAIAELEEAVQRLLEAHELILHAAQRRIADQRAG